MRVGSDVKSIAGSQITCVSVCRQMKASSQGECVLDACLTPGNIIEKLRLHCIEGRHGITTLTCPVIEISCGVGELVGRGSEIFPQNRFAGLREQTIGIGKSLAPWEQSGEWLGQLCGIECVTPFRNQCDGPENKWRVQKARNSLGMVIHKSIQANLAVTFSVERIDVVQGKYVALGRVAAV